MNNIEPCMPPDPLSTIKSPTHCFEPGLSFWQRLWQSLTNALLRADVRVWQCLNRFGNLYWQTDDPAIGRSYCYGSEAELRAWIEELRYRK